MRSLEEAVRSAVEQGHAELELLDDITGTLIGAFAHGATGAHARLDDFTRAFPDELRRHLDRERGSLGSFNIAFFGRTGAGKSTLLSTFGRLDGEYVSPGESDCTTDIRPIDWRDCRLYDTPGTNGWGRTRSREVLEAEARRAVEIADIVLLCFDSQSQQAMEFQKIASWIRAHGKPVVAVLNVRNARWRHPAKVRPASRRNLSEPVRQHVDNIRTHLAQIELHDVPVVAINSRRALFARASTPFRGPAQKDFHHEREAFGPDYLDRWSNIGALEDLIVAAIAEGGADLRLAALREDIRSRVRHGIGELEDLAATVEREAAALEDEVESLFAVVGYPEEAERARWLHEAESGADLVDGSEKARGDRPYTSPVRGSLDRFVRHLAASHLSGARQQAMARADELIRKAFDKQTAYDETKFREAVFDQAALDTAIKAVEEGRRSFLQRELEAAVDDRSLGYGGAAAHAAKVLGNKGGGIAGDLLRGSGIAVGAGAVAVPFVAVAILSNPVGWAIGLTALGVGIAGQVGQHFGKKITKDSSDQARKARARAIADSHHAVGQTFDGYEEAIVRDSREGAWTLLAPAVSESLRAATALRTAGHRIAELIDSLRAAEDGINPAPPVTDVLLRAQRRMGATPAAVTRALLGEDWLESAVDHQPASIGDAAREVYARRAEEDHSRLTRVLAGVWDTATAVRVRSWRDDLGAAARHDPELFDIERTFWRVEAARPAVVVLGDYNSGKSSLIRRILVDRGERPPAAFDIRATPATATASRYPLGGFDLVDTPGLQSGDGGHDATAFATVAEAALAVVVVHNNLMVGDTRALEELVAAKGDRTVFLINRCDELGVDPLTAPEQYLNLQDRKREELRAAFTTRSVDIGLDRIHCLSGDPFGLMSDAAPAERADFDENRAWDGVDAVTGALSGLTDEQRSAAASVAAFDAAVTDLKRHRQGLREIRADGERELKRSEPLIEALRAAVKDAGLLEGSLREDARRIVTAHVVTAKAEVARVDRGDAGKLAHLVDSWWRTPAFEADLDRFLADAARKLADWHTDHVSAIGRELRAAEFQVAPEFAAAFEAAEGTAWHENVTEKAGIVADVAAKAAKILGNRDAVYTIGKFFDVKFKPWGAVNGGLKVAKVGAVLGAIATAADIASMATDAQKDGKHRAQLESAAQAIDEAGAALVDQIMQGEQGDGPVGFLEARAGELGALLDEHLGRAASITGRMRSAQTRAAMAGALIAAADELTGSSKGNE
ncbi:50S ribosome-binding GTPase [Actinoplanes sp. LDG1-06]|uniref:50S ribosome-binding GTPase n=1 Tax=Paractinoplanes ovalisporus TaxID=2810368 RepID=A0ABS2AJX8_9ACTN|nr:GTPase [Actinoplanes ovalisporus]MBM2619688.1 50S ribosome-binding GTPase [Actinoplanes ovalisporus]